MDKDARLEHLTLKQLSKNRTVMEVKSERHEKEAEMGLGSREGEGNGLQPGFP